MRIIRFTTLLFICFSLLTRCAAPIFFQESQPAFVKQKDQFKSKFHGQYLDALDSASVVVSERTILIDPNWSENGGIDTLFTLSERNVLKYYKKKYFLNFKDQEGLWNLQLVELKDNDLIFYCFNVIEEEPGAEEINMVEIRNDCGDLVKFVMNPTRKGMKQLIREENLQKLNVYTRVDED